MRTKLPRVQALELLRAIAQNARNMITIWSWTKKMEYFDLSDPSLDRDEWRRLSMFANVMERQARELRELADGMHR